MKKVLGFLVFAMLLCVCLAACAEIVQSGTCGDALAWTLDDQGTLTISGTGDMTSHPWPASDIKKVVIQDGVTSIANYAFHNCTSLKSVTISNTVINIGVYAFCNCEQLTDVNIPNHLTRIDNYVFYSCKLLKAVTIPDSVTVIGTASFGMCESLTGLTIPDSVTTLENKAFVYCTALTEIAIPDHVTAMGDNIFNSCKSLNRIKIGKGLDTIPDYAFTQTALNELRIPENVTSLGKGIIDSCHEIKAVSLAGKNVSFSKETFPAYIEPDFLGTERNVFYTAPSGSETLKRLQDSGLLCSSIGNTGLTLKTPLSSDPDHPTRIKAIKNGQLDLSNTQGFKVVKVIDYYTRADMPRNDAMWKDYQKEYVVTDNTWSYDADGKYFDHSALLLVYEDAAGNLCCSDLFYVVYGKAQLNEPVITSHDFQYTRDGYALVPPEELTVSWVPSDNSTYEVTLFHSVETAYLGNWSAKNLQTNSVTIPNEELLPNSLPYMITVTTINTETGDKLSMRSSPFIVYGSDVVKDKAVLTRPFKSNNMSANENTCPIVQRTGDLTFTWNPVENAVSYQITVEANYSSGFSSTVFSQKTDETFCTVPETKFESYFQKNDIKNFSVIITSFDRYGNSTNDPKKTYSSTYFCFGNPSLLNATVDGTVLSLSSDTWTGLSSGSHTFDWNSVSDADSYTVNLVRKDNDRFYIHDSQTLTASETSWTCTLRDGFQYILVIHAKAGDQILNGGWWYMAVNRQEHTTPLLLTPTSAFYREKNDSLVSWTDTGALTYKVMLCKYLNTDYTSETNILTGELQPYYSEIIESHETNETFCSFPGSLLEYGCMYRILLTAIYSDGVETRVDHLFKVTGDPNSRPEIGGVVTSVDPSQPGINQLPQNIRATWQAHEGIDHYEIVLYTAKKNGDPLELVTSQSSQSVEQSLPASLLHGKTDYLLMLRAYDQDSFSNEYRFWFHVDQCAEHQVVADPARNPTCTETGLTAGSHCKACGEILTAQEIVSMAPHTLTAHSGTAPTCLEAGTEAYWSCDVCTRLFSDADGTKEIEEPVAIQALGHEEAISDAIQPDCIHNGWSEYTYCNRCGVHLTDSKEIPALGHDEVTVPAVEPGCYEGGWTEYIRCNRCGDCITYPEQIPALEHLLVEDPDVEPTCTEPGWTERAHCAHCGIEMSDPQAIPALGHQEVIDPAVPPTYEATGLTEGSHCGRCGAVLVQQQVVPKLDILPGDVNGDGEVDGRDVIRLMKHLAKETDPETGNIYLIRETNADVTGDGEVDEKDLLRLVRYLGGEAVRLEAGKSQ